MIQSPQKLKQDFKENLRFNFLIIQYTKCHFSKERISFLVPFDSVLVLQ